MDMPGLPVSQRHILSLKPDKDKAEVEETPAPNNSLESTHRETTKSVGHDRTLFRKEYIDRLFMCPVCGGVLNDPMVLLDCGHHFCRECILKTPSRSTCPACGCAVKDSSKITPDLAIQQHVDDFRVYCLAKRQGCTWKGHLRDRLNHHRSKHCKAFCTRGCGVLVSRLLTADHDRTCTLRKISCPYKAIGNGCAHQCKREDMMAHMSEMAGQHAMLAAAAITQLTASLWKVSSLPSEECKTEKTVTFVKLDTYFKTGKPMVIEPFYIGPVESGYRLSFKLTPHPVVHGRHSIDFSCLLVKGRNDRNLEWPFDRITTLTFRHSLTGKEAFKHQLHPPPSSTRDYCYRCRRPDGDLSQPDSIAPCWRLGAIDIDPRLQTNAILCNKLCVTVSIPWRSPRRHRPTTSYSVAGNP